MANYELTRDSAVVVPGALADERVRSFLRSVYGWMAVGLAITAITALYVASTPALVITIATNRLLFWGLIIAQFGIVLMLAARVQQLAPATAATLFVAYSALTGVTISFILLVYTGESVVSTFLVAAGMFGATATGSSCAAVRRSRATRRKSWPTAALSSPDPRTASGVIRSLSGRPG